MYGWRHRYKMKIMHQDGKGKYSFSSKLLYRSKGEKPHLGLDAVADAWNALACLLHALYKLVRIQLLLAGVLKTPANGPWHGQFTTHQQWLESDALLREMSECGNVKHGASDSTEIRCTMAEGDDLAR